MNHYQSISSSINHATIKAISNLENERKNHYKESIHLMRFPKHVGFTSENEVHEGLIFQLTIILDALICCQETGNMVNNTGIDQDMQKIVLLKDEKLNSWKYFPTLPELPPDIDDLAQIIQIFRKRENTVLNDAFEEVNQLILRFANLNGSINTWIFDHEDRSPSYYLMRKATQTMWGEKPDVEVIANYLYSLFLINKEEYKKPIADGIQFIIKKQKRAGYWTSTWYWGNYYGTYMCTRLLIQYPEYHTYLEKTLQFLIRSQNDDGSWDKPKYANNNSAFAILALVELYPIFPDLNAIITDGIGYLCAKQHDDGSWNASDFIKMKTDRVSGFVKMLMRIRRSNVLTYQSRTITTAIILKALCQYSKCMK